jgi:putative transposase
MMKLLKAYKYRLKIGPNDEASLARFSGCARFVWNHALSFQKELLDGGSRCLPYELLTSQLPVWKKEFPFLKDVHSQILQQRLKELCRAIDAAFDPKDAREFPKFKKKHKSTASFRYPQGFKLEGNRVFLPKIGWMRFYKSRDIDGVLKNCTVSKRGQHWYISIQTMRDIPPPVHPASSIAGADMGVRNTLTMSDGTMYGAANSLRIMISKLAVMQRKLSRMVKRSNNWKKQKLKINRLHVRISDMRKDHLHKVSSEVSKNHAVLVLEDLDVRNMSASAKGTISNPGKNVKRKSALNRSILDQGWYELRRQIEYKMSWRGGQVLFVHPAGTSRTCSCCGHVSPENRPSQALFYCVKCGHTENADVNAAKVILGAGQALLACGSNGAAMPSEAGTVQKHY